MVPESPTAKTLLAELPHTLRRVFPVGDVIDSHPASAHSGKIKDITTKTNNPKAFGGSLI
jgi:hypothetical protein